MRRWLGVKRLVIVLSGLGCLPGFASACSEDGVTSNCPALLLANSDASDADRSRALAAAVDAGCVTAPAAGGGANVAGASGGSGAAGAAGSN